MSIDLNLFLPVRVGPSIADLEEELGGNELFENSNRSLPVTELSGFLPLAGNSAQGSAFGLEVTTSAVTEQRINEFQQDLKLFGGDEGDQKYLNVLMRSTLQVTLSGRTKEEASVARSIAAAAAKMTGGWAYDPQNDDWIY